MSQAEPKEPSEFEHLVSVSIYDNRLHALLLTLCQDLHERGLLWQESIAAKALEMSDRLMRETEALEESWDVQSHLRSSIRQKCKIIRELKADIANLTEFRKEANTDDSSDSD
jgi:uncharacterized protein YjaG (DUF416 family)